MAEPQPNVLNFASSIILFEGFTLICNFKTSPQAGAPTIAVPIFFVFLEKLPTFLGVSKCSTRMLVYFIRINLFIILEFIIYYKNK